MLPPEKTNDAWRWNLDTYAEHVSNGQWVPYDWHVYLAEQLAQAVLAGNKRIIITAPPRHGKSELTSRWLPTWFLDMHPTKRVILSSYAIDLARSWSVKVRDNFEKNEHTWGKLNPKNATKEEWYLTEGGGMKAVGVGGGITGFGGDLVLIDDPHKDWAEVQSATQRQRVIDWFNGTLYHRLEPDATIILIQTRWNEGDLAGYLLSEHEDDWVEIRMPALAEENDALGREVGAALCPERYDEARLQQIRRAVGPQVFAGLFQQRPAPAEGNLIKREWVKYYGGPTGIELPVNKGKMFQSWDLNFGEETQRGSFNVGQVWLDYKGFWLVAQERGRWEYTVTKAKVRAMAAQYPLARAKYIEKKAAGAPLLSDLKETVKGMIGVNPRGSKEARLQAVAPFFESGDVWFPHPAIAPWVRELVEEVVSAPNAQYDDQSDTLSQALSQGKSRSAGDMKLNLDIGIGAPAWRIT